jgi:predicted TPR repeat methyltransferase
MAIGDSAGAKVAYKKALAERPRSGFSLYGIALSSEQAGNVAAATVEYAEFLAAQKNADPGIAQVTHAKTYLAEHRPLPEALSKQRERYRPVSD